MTIKQVDAIQERDFRGHAEHHANGDANGHSNGVLSKSTTEPLPYWQVNVPPSQRTLTCPDFLQNVNEKDQGILSTPDDEFHILTWPEVRAIIAANRLDLFQRVPSDLRRYLAYNWQIKQQWGSVMEFVLSQKLAWEVPVSPRGRPFEFPEDWQVRWNDWPYGIDGKIVHLVVWTKFDLEDDPVTGDLTPQARKEIDEFVKRTFCSKISEENVSSCLEFPPDRTS
jgi:hypothetical protein